MDEEKEALFLDALLGIEDELTKQNDLLARNNAAMQGVLLALKEIPPSSRGVWSCKTPRNHRFL